MDIIELLEYMQSSPISWFILAVCTVICVPLAIYFGIRGKTKKQLSYAFISNKVIQNASSKIPNIKVLYKEKNVENLVISRLAIWNSGSNDTTINKEDIVNCDPLKITIKNGILLDVKVLYQNEKDNQISIEKTGDENEALIGFNYLDKSNGAVFEIIHDSKNDDFVFTGKIKGSKSLNKVYDESANITLSSAKKFIYYMSNLFVPIILTLSIIGIDLSSISPTLYKLLNSPPPFTILIISNILLIIILADSAKKIFSKKLPKDLRKSMTFIETY